MLDVVLHPGRDHSVRRRHPWILSGAVASVDGDEPASPGARVRVRSAQGETLGHGHLSPHSRIRVRMLVFGPEEPAEDCLARRIAAATARRGGEPLLDDTDALRLVNAEGDGLPGLVADRYGDLVVVKLTAAGMLARREEIAAALREATGASAGYERADGAAARQEGMPARQGPLWGAEPAGPVPVREHGRHYRVDAAGGQKTGFYLDQRDARSLVQRLASGRSVLDLFAYTGGFAVAAACGGAARVTLVESSAPALSLAAEHLQANAPGCTAKLERADAFRFVRAHRERYDLVVVDPPPLARRAREVPKAARAYKDVLLHALRCAAPGAYLLAFACSHHVDAALFRKIAFGAALDAGRDARVVGRLGAPADHPVSLYHPEGEYLTGLLLSL